MRSSRWTYAQYKADNIVESTERHILSYVFTQSFNHDSHQTVNAIPAANDFPFTFHLPSAQSLDILIEVVPI